MTVRWPESSQKCSQSVHFMLAAAQSATYSFMVAPNHCCSLLCAAIRYLSQSMIVRVALLSPRSWSGLLGAPTGSHTGCCGHQSRSWCWFAAILRIAPFHRRLSRCYRTPSILTTVYSNESGKFVRITIERFLARLVVYSSNSVTVFAKFYGIPKYSHCVKRY